MKGLFRYLLALGALLAFWQIGSVALGEFLLPRPLEVLAYFGESLTTGAFWQHAGASAWRVASAMSLAWIVAFPLGLVQSLISRTSAIFCMDLIRKKDNSPESGIR